MERPWVPPRVLPRLKPAMELLCAKFAELGPPPLERMPVAGDSKCHCCKPHCHLNSLTMRSEQLYRECLRRAKYIGSKQYNAELLVIMVRQQFKKHMHEKDPEKIQKLKDDAARGLINHMLYESERLSGCKFSQGS